MKIVEVNRENFNEEVLKNKKTVLVDFYADWCGPCRMIKPIIEEIAENNDDVKIVSINIENEGELAEKYSISSIPCLVIFENGEEIKRSIGLISKNNIEKTKLDNIIFKNKVEKNQPEKISTFKLILPIAKGGYGSVGLYKKMSTKQK